MNNIDLDHDRIIRINWKAGLIGGACVLWAVSLFMIYLGLMSYIDGVSVLDSREKLEQFAKKKYQDATLVYDKAYDLYELFTVTTRGLWTEKTEYAVWRLEGEGYVALYCTNKVFNDGGEAHVQSMHHHLTPELSEHFATGEANVFVVYDAGSPVPFMVMIGSMMALGFLLFILSRRMKFSR